MHKSAENHTCTLEEYSLYSSVHPSIRIRAPRRRAAWRGSHLVRTILSFARLGLG